MILSQRIRLLVIGLLTLAVPAYANNPPQPDGLFSVLLIFPIAILGARFAGVASRQTSIARRIVDGIVVTGLILFLLAGTVFGIFAALCLLAYAVIHASQMIRLGQGTKRIVLGSVVVLFSLFAVADYAVSSVANHSSLVLHESATLGNLRSITSAQLEFSKSAKDHDAETYATLSELENAGSLPPRFSGGRIVSGYHYVEFLDAHRKRFIVYAVPTIPAAGRTTEAGQVHFIPGSSLFRAVFHVTEREEGTGYRSFAVDETRVIRWAVRSSQDSPVRDEYIAWQPLQ